MSIQHWGMRIMVNIHIHSVADGNSFATGWNYFFKYVFLIGTNLTASGMVMQYWSGSEFFLLESGARLMATGFLD